jgi:hypothetical protein
MTTLRHLNGRVRLFVYSGINNLARLYYVGSMWSVIVRERTLSTCLFAHLGVHEAERHAHGDGEQPDEDDLEHDPSPGLVASEAHGVAQAEEAVHADGAEVHDGGGAEQHVQAHPRQAVLAGQREEAYTHTKSKSKRDTS